MTAEELKNQLESFGFQLFPEGNNIRYRFFGKKIPDDAKPLLQELARCKKEIIHLLNKTNNTIWKNPYPLGSPAAREESLLQIMDTKFESTFSRVAAIWPQGFVSTQEILTAEDEVARIQSLVLSGKAKLADFQKAVGVWELTVSRAVNKKI